MNKKVLLDTNAILRYLLDDIHEQNIIVTEKIESHDCFCILPVIQEAVYVLEGYYSVPRDIIKTQFLLLKNVIEIEDEDIFTSAFEYYTETPKIDFADCILCGYQKNRNVDVLSFDQKLLKKLNTISDNI